MSDRRPYASTPAFAVFVGGKDTLPVHVEILLPLTGTRSTCVSPEEARALARILTAAADEIEVKRCMEVKRCGYQGCEGVMQKYLKCSRCGNGGRP